MRGTLKLESEKDLNLSPNVRQRIDTKTSEREREEFSDRQSDGKNEWKRENSVERKSVK